MSHPGNGRTWSRLAYGYAVLLAVGLGYFMLRTPYQVSDNLAYILIAQSTGYGELLASNFVGTGSIRPVMWLQQKVLFHLAPDGHYMTTFKLFHVAQLVGCVVLFVRLLRVRSAIDFAALPMTLAAFVGIHTFAGSIREGYPINHFMTVLLLCVVAANLAASTYRRWHDVAAMFVVGYALLLFETGILTWVCLVAAYVGGWRGVSGRGVTVSTAVLVLYLVLRFAVLDVGSRGVGAMDSGFGFSMLNGSELNARFGDAPWRFYLYNVGSAALSVLFAEPREGVFQFTQAVVEREIPPWSAINVAVSTLGTILIAVYAFRRLRRWRTARSLEHEDALLLMFTAVFGANAVMTYPYLKEVVISPAGMFYCAALFLATRDLLTRRSIRWTAAALLPVPLVLLSAGWTLRAATSVAGLAEVAFTHRNDWAMAEVRMDEKSPGWRDEHPDAERLAYQLRDEVIHMPVPQPFTLRWMRGWVDPY